MLPYQLLTTVFIFFTFSWCVVGICGKHSFHYQSTSVNAPSDHERHTQTFKQWVWNELKRIRKHSKRFSTFSFRVINHNINTSNNSDWKKRGKGTKTKRRQEQLSETYPEHSVLQHECSVLRFTWARSAKQRKGFKWVITTNPRIN